MRYKYTRYLNELKDLKHIEWFVLHSEEYEFDSEESKRILDRLKRNIHNKNVFYSEIIRDYSMLLSKFDNDPYNYIYDIVGEKENVDIKSSHYSNYFVSIKDKDGDSYMVPFRYILENPIEYDVPNVKKAFEEKMKSCKDNARSNFYAVWRKYEEYFNEGGVASALKRFESVGRGKSYNIPKMLIMYFIYNIILLIILNETQFWKVVTHFWQIFSDGVYSSATIFPEHKYFGIVLILFTAYFVVLDFYYTYGIYYCIYMKKKYSAVRKYHDTVQACFNEFDKDYQACKKGISGEIMVKRNNRTKVYLTLIELTKRRYNFMVQRVVEIKDEEGNLKKEKEAVTESITVPVEIFYKQPLRKRLLGIIILLIVVQAVCGMEYLMFYY